MQPPKLKDYPKHLKLGDTIYTIRFVRKFDDDPRQVGECCPSECEIKIKLGLGREETFKTLIHEIAHGLFEFEHDLKVKHRLIYGMEQALYQFLIDNF